MILDNDHVNAALQECGVPDYMRDGIVRYLVHGIAPGHFLIAVFENNLMEALSRADAVNQQALPAYGRFLYNHAPGASWGSPKKVAAWMALRVQPRTERQDV